MTNRKAAALMMAVKSAPLSGRFIEIGCIREDHEVPTDGYSTVYLTRYCHEKGLDFKSYDISPENVERANAVLAREGLPQSVCYRDGLEALSLVTDRPISFLYLDSHRDPNFRLEQYRAAWLAPGCIVAIDDAHSYDGWEFGKATHLKDIFDARDIPYTIFFTEPGFKMLVAKIELGKEPGELGGTV